MSERVRACDQGYTFVSGTGACMCVCPCVCVGDLACCMFLSRGLLFDQVCGQFW